MCAPLEMHVLLCVKHLLNAMGREAPTTTNPALIPLSQLAFVFHGRSRRVTDVGAWNHTALWSEGWLARLSTQSPARPNSRDRLPGRLSGDSGRNLPPGSLRPAVGTDGAMTPPFSLLAVSWWRCSLPLQAAHVPSCVVPSTIQHREGTSHPSHSFNQGLDCWDQAPPNNLCVEGEFT